MRFTFEIDSFNIALTDGAEYELARLLRQTAERVESGYREGILRDYNGNAVGAWAYEREEN